MLSFVDGHLGGFRVLAIVDSAAVTLGMRVSFGIRVFSWFKPRSVTAAHVVALFSVF